MRTRPENDAVAFVVLRVAKLRAKFSLNQAKGAAAVGPLAHDRSPDVREYGDRTGDGLCRKGISRECGDGILQVHIVRRKAPRVLCFRSLTGIPAKTVLQRAKKGPPAKPGGSLDGRNLVRNLVRPFGCLPRSSGSSRFRQGFAAIELAHDVGADGPRSDFGRRRFLALAVRPLVGRADEFAFDEDVSALPDSRSDTLCFLVPFSWGTQKREAAASKASGCFMGGNPMV
jgi:hypothetical protein